MSNNVVGEKWKSTTLGGGLAHESKPYLYTTSSEFDFENIIRASWQLIAHLLITTKSDNVECVSILDFNTKSRRRHTLDITN